MDQMQEFLWVSWKKSYVIDIARNCVFPIIHCVIQQIKKIFEYTLILVLLL